MHQTRCPEQNRDNTEPQRDHARCFGAVHDSAVQRLRGSEDVRHGLSRPESTLLDYCVQLEWKDKRFNFYFDKKNNQFLNAIKGYVCVRKHKIRLVMEKSNYNENISQNNNLSSLKKD